MSSVNRVNQVSKAIQVPGARILRARKFYDEARRQRDGENVRYAIYALGRAICEDPAQRQYAKELIATLSLPAARARNGLTGLLKRFRLRRKLGQAITESRWDDVLATATQLAAFYPQDRSILIALSQGCVGLKCYDSAVVFLRFAHKLWPQDLVVNQHCGRVLGHLGMFDEAIGCWHRVKEHLPHDNEALTEMSRLATAKVFG